ncbi:hypothetical protein Daus18300_013019 [Diaporthe australafricana]|uniref:AT hook domain-containing protein n=1 Tax=Diaporthe australafricana TaxID=127596 RepID=A0ABR3W0P7_9PEZI
MSNRRVIYDSEDEDAGLSPINSPVKGGVEATDGSIVLAGDAGGEPRLGESTIDQRSTDPDFFQKIYNEQQHIADSAPIGRVEGISSDKQRSSDLKAKNSSSITDPTLKSAKKKKTRATVEARDFADLTQVTTPRNDGSSGSHKDVYDFPSSDGEGDGVEPKTKAKTAKTYSKRKRGQAVTPATAMSSSSPAHPSVRKQGLSLTHMQDDEDVSPNPSRKTRSNGTQQTPDGVDEDVDLLVVPRTADARQAPTGSQDGGEGQGSVVPDTLNELQNTGNQMPASFFIAPPNHLTASQKQEYLRISGSSELDSHANHENALPVPLPETQAQKLRSSEATIAYTTPSRYCSSAPGFPEHPENDGRNSSGVTTSSRQGSRNNAVHIAEPHSSPDELNSPILKQLGPRTKRKRNTVQVDELAQDDSWDSDKIGYAREQYNPRPSRRRSGIDEDEQPAQADEAAGGTREKRQKTDQDRNSVQEDSWDSDKIGAHRESYRPRPSRRKSRAVLDVEDEDLATPERSMPDTCPPGPGVSEGTRDAQPILISSGQQAPQERSDAIEGIEGIDPGYLAALTEDLRQEVIADQQARKSQASRTRGRGRPSEGGSNDVPRAEETPQPKKRGRKKKETAKEDGSTVAEEADTQAIAATTTPATKKKRGRPKKSETNQPPPAPAADDDISIAYEVEDVSKVADETGVTEAQPQVVKTAPAPPRAPSKRGRKKKVLAETISPPEEEESSIHGAEEAVNSEYQEATIKTKAPAKRGRKRKVVEEPLSADESDGRVESSQQELEAGSDAEEDSQAAAERQRKALTDISNTASSKGPAEGTEGKRKASPRDIDDMQGEATPEAKTKEMPRSASSATNQQGKVPLRVGLSKRSRIAPLLKIIRK